MKTYTNVNLKGSGHTFTYIFEYIDDDILVSSDNIQYFITSKGDIIFEDGDTDLIRDVNEWKYINKDSISWENDKMPSVHNVSKLRLYFPQYSIDTYHSGTSYAIEISTYMYGKKIILGNYLSSRMDALACSPARFAGNDYFEYVDLNIINPWVLIYGPEWEEFRRMVYDNSLGYENNDLGYILNIVLYPVEEVDGVYYNINGYDGSQNSIIITDYKDYLRLSAIPNIKTPILDRPGITCKLEFNDVYNGDLLEYMKETYNLTDYQLTYELVVKDNDNIYKHIISDVSSDTTTHFFDCSSLFGSWNGFKEGLTITCGVNVINHGEEIMYIRANNIAVTQELMSYMLFEEKDIYNINLEDVDMKVYNVKAINKTVNNIIQLDRPEDSKSNIIQPVFFRSYELPNVVIHPEVTEHIQLNLDIYKPRVDSFILQIEGCAFVESGRSGNGIIFKIPGNTLPMKNMSGTYYILNQDSELVTTGKYTYEV